MVFYLKNFACFSEKALYGIKLKHLSSIDYKNLFLTI